MLFVWLCLGNNVSYADTHPTVAMSASSTSLTLSPKEIKRLRQLFPMKADANSAMPSFTNDVLPEHLVWKQAPLTITLPVNKERMITFPEAIVFGYNKNNLPDNMLRVQNNNGTLYLLAKAPFATQRVAVRLTSSGKIVLLDITAQKQAATTPIDVVIPANNLATDNASPAKVMATADANGDEDISNTNINDVTLMRFVVQQLYAPKRLLTQPNGIYRIPMHTPKTVTLLRDNSVIAMPLASWHSGEHTVTAILLRNNLKQPLTLDPRTLCGTWQAATFYPRDILDPAGTPSDSTTVFVITNQSFSNALRLCMAGN